jgi:S-adenosylmethionine hydrolase
MITLLSDFGTTDYFVPAVKGVLLSINPQVQIIDITHEIAAQDIFSAAFTLGACYRNFPLRTIHVAIVDPGVGSKRRPVIVEAGGYLFVGPDNGIFSFVYARESEMKVFHILREEYFRRPVSPTFHGRDVFAPVAARLSLGDPPGVFGERVEDYVKFVIPRPKVKKDPGPIEGSVIHIDRFGNCITNFATDDLLPGQSSIKMQIKSQEIKRFGTHFEQAAGKGDLIAYPGSAGYWEIAVWRGSAAEVLDVRVGDQIVVELNPRSAIPNPQ